MENIKKLTSLKVPAKASLWYIISAGFARAIGALSVPIFTRLLSPEEFGVFSLYSSWLGIFTVLVTLEITGSVIYRGFQRFEDKKDEFASAALGLLGAIFVCFCALYFASRNFVEIFTGLNASVSIFMFVEILGIEITSLYLAKAKFEYKYKAVSAINLISAILIPFSAIVLILLTKIRSEARIYASSITTLAIAIPLLFLVLKRSDKLYSKEIWWYLIKHSLPLLPHYFAVSLILRAVEISIGRNHGTASLGQYSVAMSVGMILTVVTGGILSALTPWIMRKIREGGIDKIRDFLLLLTRSLSLLALLVLAVAPEILSILAAEGFRSALPSIYPLEIAAVLSFISGAIVSASAYYEKGALSSLASISAATVSVMLSFLMLPRIDYRFAGIFVLVSYLIMALFSSFIFKRLSGEYPMHIKKSLLILFLTSAYAVILYAFRGVVVSRIFLALPIVSLLLISAKDIYEKIKE